MSKINKEQLEWFKKNMAFPAHTSPGTPGVWPIGAAFYLSGQELYNSDQASLTPQARALAGMAKASICPVVAKVLTMHYAFLLEIDFAYGRKDKEMRVREARLRWMLARVPLLLNTRKNEFETMHLLLKVYHELFLVIIMPMIQILGLDDVINIGRVPIDEEETANLTHEEILLYAAWVSRLLLFMDLVHQPTGDGPQRAYKAWAACYPGGGARLNRATWIIRSSAYYFMYGAQHLVNAIGDFDDMCNGHTQAKRKKAKVSLWSTMYQAATSLVILGSGGVINKDAYTSRVLDHEQNKNDAGDTVAQLLGAEAYERLGQHYNMLKTGVPVFNCLSAMPAFRLFNLHILEY